MHEYQCKECGTRNVSEHRLECSRYSVIIGGKLVEAKAFEAIRKETVLEEANRIIYGDREQTYGHPAKNFEATANLWNGYIKAKVGVNDMHKLYEINATDVAHMMMLLKMARELHIHKRDNVVDMAGYAGCIQKMKDYEDHGS